MKILVVDDDQWTTRLLKTMLEDAKYQVVTAEDGPTALRAVSAEELDLVLLDLMLPGMDGNEVCRRIREMSEVPIVVLSAKTATHDKVDLLQLGADDYIQKPFEPAELVARVHAVLRRSLGATHDAPEGKIKVGEVEVDPVSGTAIIGGQKSVYLTPTELRLLYTLMRNAGRVLTRDMLRDHAWGYDYVGGSNDVDVYVRRLRMKLEKDRANPRFILTERGIGYKFAPAAPAAAP
jgi:DNA-binding response OmpR family regulator